MERTNDPAWPNLFTGIAPLPVKRLGHDSRVPNPNPDCLDLYEILTAYQKDIECNRTSKLKQRTKYTS